MDIAFILSLIGSLGFAGFIIAMAYRFRITDKEIDFIYERLRKLEKEQE